ncbi:hypothetical protein HRI_000672000 [Hibiscus trionum]|uniref:Uncharacterized protein n=1 Tax=Hibiscus trionum TaxID=183268 RepID=A0A9W7H2U3_HIBTR|nr:hypothetical protein HRI_000672000 [Hibiscus trionum]
MMTLESLDLRKSEKFEKSKPTEAMEMVDIYPNEPKKLTRIVEGLDKQSRRRLIRLLQDNDDVFAWSAADMPGIDPTVIRHFLHVDSTVKPV